MRYTLVRGTGACANKKAEKVGGQIFRTPGVRKLLWALVSLVAVGNLQMNWTTGQSRFVATAIVLLGASVGRPDLASAWLVGPGLASLFARLYPALDALGVRYEIVFIDGGLPTIRSCTFRDNWTDADRLGTRRGL